MSKWLRRGQASTSNNFVPSAGQQSHPSDFPQPPRNEMPPSASSAVYHHQPPPPQQSPIGGYGAPPPSTMPMDVDGQPPRSSKYGQTSPYHSQQSGPQSHYDPMGRVVMDDHHNRNRLSGSSRDRRSRPQQQHTEYGRHGAMHAPDPFGVSPFKGPMLGSSTPPDSIQPSSPPPAVTADSPQPSSEVVPRRPAYLLHRDLVIGKGSYGQVCIASRGEPEGHSSGRSGKRKKFACKCVMLRNDPKYIAKLQEEVNVLRELRGHDNVIRLYDVFCVDNELFIITELGRGGDLFHLLTTHPKHGVTESYAAKTVSEMLSAVAFLHSRNICHRDLKLENWVLESGKDVWSPLKLIDFGLSTHFTAGQRLSRVVGSSYYVAPEVLKKSYTEACDLWSLGVIVYMLLSGAPPFYGKNDEAIKASIVQGEYTFPHELFRDVSDEAMAFVSTLLSYNIEYRYTADQALTHPWLALNCDPEALHKCKNGARGIGIVTEPRLDPMQL
ncbi:hypothetical protein FisN_3Hh022 [Fistulifera solaris]|uniref:Protein kinase domain-containing protein n=1 Tax=Fistulifera solaris TaxID=1519565 RepID=A0A1Z5KT48_FISSO|nr:hypothetical protein FisN_3Hh022 [Fistulifera solaris]|eukprot:GAX29504.1 hypothetical protein FisN_3Hh022 [Fistulifera solaris]